MTDAEFLDEMARKSNVFSTEAGVRMTPEERDRLVALGREVLDIRTALDSVTKCQAPTLAQRILDSFQHDKP